MARSRNIKPGLFKNEDLAECSIWARFLFPGLWCIADRAGRLEDRPKRIKGELLAFDTVDVEPLLAELASHDFIARYEVDGQKIIQILTFGKHQNPHFREQPSVLPPMPGWKEPKHDIEKPEASGGFNDAKARGKPGATPASKATEAQGQPEALDRESDLQRGVSPADSLFSDSLIPEEIPEPNGSLSASPQPPEPDEPDDGVPPCPFDSLIDSYEAALPALPTVRRSLFVKGASGKSLRARWRWVMTEKHERGERKGERLATTAEEGKIWFTRYFDYVADSDFLSGRNGKFQACDLGWLVTAANFEKVLSGKYHGEQREVTHA